MFFFLVVYIHHNSSFMEMYEWVEQLISSKHLICLFLKPFQNKKESSGDSRVEIADQIYPSGKEDVENTELKWKYLASFLDRLCFITHVVFMVVVLAVFFYQTTVA